MVINIKIESVVWSDEDVRTKEIDEKTALATLANNPIAKQDFLDRQSPTVALAPHHQLSLLSVDFLLYSTS